jgi:predicted regulator of Ras-like GTPase activity (Roadblock/LC7/MglB family)
MPDRPPNGGPSVADAEVAIARLEAMSADLRGCAIVAPDGSLLAASGDADAWATAADGVIAAADAAAGEPVTHAHVGTEDGEVFVVREQGFVLVAATDRFALAGLMVFDIRAALRDLIRGPDAKSVRDAAAEAA